MVTRKRCRNAGLTQAVHLVIAVSIALGSVMTIGVVESYACHRWEAGPRVGLEGGAEIRQLDACSAAGTCSGVDPSTAKPWVPVAIIGGLALIASLLTLLAEWLMRP